MKARYFLFVFCLPFLLYACTSTKNTAGTRWYHAINTRYNIYFNGDQAYQQALKTQEEEYVTKENFSKLIWMYPSSALPKDKQTTGGPFNKAIEKSVKAIKRHSIQTKPEKEQGKRNDPKYKEFMSRTEYNPFLYKAWLLMAKSQFYNGDFLQASSSFSYIARLYASQPAVANEAIIWKARAYDEMTWYFEAEDLLSKLNPNTFTKEQKHEFAAVKADLFIKQKQYTEAIPYLQTAIDSEKNKLQKTREKYLLGQLYAQTGQKALAYQTFGQINSRYAPYILELSAKIRQTEVYSQNDTTKMARQLRKMTKSSKNKDYLDQIYYALGNVYLSVPDTAKAVASYEKGMESSTQNGIDKVLNEIKLGDIYFEQRKYVQAQPNYADALSQLKKEDEDYPRVSKRSEVLDALLVHYEAVELQDSLQRLYKMSEEERLAVVNKIIADLIKKEKEEQKKADRDEYLSRQEENRNSMNPRGGGVGAVMPPSDPNLFYFYNTQAVAIGKTAFQQKWGRRKLEDDWRRKNKISPMDVFDENSETENPDENNESVENQTENIEDKPEIPLSDDPKDPQFYLQQIPKTEEDIEASNLIIVDGLYNMGVIYKDLLEDAGLALETFHTLDARFPDNENKLMAYYHTYLIYLRQGNQAMADLYKRKIIEAFPDSEYAIAMADPNYEYNRRMMDVVLDSIYQTTYEAYLNGNPKVVQQNYQQVTGKYAQSPLMPKFMFLNALSYVQTHDDEGFKKQLKELISKYPEADVSVLAAEMMKGFQRGLSLSKTGNGRLANGSLFTTRFGAGEEMLENDSSLVFAEASNIPHKLLIIYEKGTLNDNLLLYTVAGFNFGNFKLNDFDLDRTNMGNINLLQVQTFHNLSEVMQYVKMIYEPEGYAQTLGTSAVIVPISLENYNILTKGKRLEDYLQFFENLYGKVYPELIGQWRKTTEDVENTEKKEVKEKEASEEIEIEDDMPILEIPLTEVKKEENDSTAVVSEEDLLMEKMNDRYNEASDLFDNVNNTIDEIADDPVRGILNLFKKKSSDPISEYAKEQEKLAKEQRKQEEKEKREREKAAKAEAQQQAKQQRELLKQQETEAKTQQKEAEAKAKAEQKAIEDAKKAKAEEKKRLQKEKDEARKKKQAEYKARQKQKEEERKAKEKARQEQLKAKKK
ncbi:MAG: tetratricopeptide repeat protein [Dysgonamonadaceae bacterium]|jgi:tetratricopeptide (TPR) repeat protein|nr:tetratricopeptide repeat protein [Dysgonamonadaceae bacterium]